MKVLFIDILSESASSSKSFAEDSEFNIEYVASVSKALEKIHLYEYDCILLYCSLATKSAQETISEIAKADNNNGLILLLKEDTVEDKIQALNSGADDCLTIPYHPKELTARILAVVRRKKFNTRDKIYFANMIIDMESMSVFVWDLLISLTRKEYEILLYLIMNRTKTASQTRIVDYIWGDETANKEASNLLITHIKNLRKKLSATKAEVEIKNAYGVGYKIIEL